MRVHMKEQVRAHDMADAMPHLTEAPGEAC